LSGEPAAKEGADPKARILVVDDNEDNRDMLSRRLRRKGYDCETADDGASALEEIAKGEFDLVLLDVMMPGMSGVECLKKIRAGHAKTRLPVIMATAKTDSKSVVEALGEGANDYVTKPIDFPVLLARLESQLSIREETAEVRRTSSIDVSGGIDTGTIIDDRYEILGMVGHGGFAAVYRAKQLSTGQTVAFKCLSPERVVRDPSTVEVRRFVQEMNAIGKIDHPNVVRLIDSGRIRCSPGSVVATGAGWSEFVGESTDHVAPTVAKTPTADRRKLLETQDTDTGDPVSGPRQSAGDDEMLPQQIELPFIVMEYLEGETLGSVLSQRESLPPEEAVDLALPVVGALSAAHDEGIVHRDVKPANIFLVENKKGDIVPKVLDFGIAKLIERTEELTVDDSFIGTPEYMSPEQGRGERDLDPRADQFSVAAILYHCITGQKLYTASSLIGLVRKVSEGDYLPPSELVEELPEGFEDVLLRALDVDRDRRFTSVVSFGKALLPFASERARRVWQDQFDTATDPPPPARPRLVTNPDTLRDRVDPTGPTQTPPRMKTEDPDTTARGKKTTAADEVRSAVAPEQPPLWMWFALLVVLAALGWAALSLGL
jgi:serine/threonine protein kinase/ActR/RegA family two-component response regulator